MAIKMRKAGMVMALAVVGGASVAEASASYVTGFEQPEYVPGGLITVTSQAGWSAPSIAGPQIMTEAELAETLLDAGLNAGVTAPVVHSGTQALLATGVEGSSAVVRPFPEFSSASVVEVEFWARPLTPGADGSGIGANEDNSFINIQDSAGRRAVAVKFGVNTDGDDTTTPIEVYSSNGGWIAAPVQWSADNWYKIGLVLDYDALTYDLYIDGTKINTSAGIDFYHMDSASFDELRIWTGSGQAGLIIDDLSIAAPEPSALALLLTAGVATVMRRQRV